MSGRRFITFVALLTALFVGDLRAQATPGTPQQPPSQSTTTPTQVRKWELEAHGGWLLNINQSRGRNALPTTGSIVGGQVSVTSFFFGEGARFLSPTLTPLDAVLRAPAFEWQQQILTVGIRLDRAVRRRFIAEVSADYNRATLSATDAALRGIETSRASVATALQQLLANRPVTSVVSAATTVSDAPTGSQLAATGSVLVNLRATGKAMPYVTGGGGVVFNMVDPAKVNVTGRYALGNPAQIFGVDSVTVQYSPNSREFMGIVGGGLKYYATPRWGVRFDGRVRLYPNKMANLVDATPVVTLRSTGSPFPVINIGMLQFSSTAPLTGAPITQFSTFTGDGLRTQVSAAAGVFWRF